MAQLFANPSARRIVALHAATSSVFPAADFRTSTNSTQHLADELSTNGGRSESTSPVGSLELVVLREGRGRKGPLAPLVLVHAAGARSQLFSSPLYDHFLLVFFSFAILYLIDNFTFSSSFLIFISLISI